MPLPCLSTSCRRSPRLVAVAIGLLAGAVGHAQTTPPVALPAPATGAATVTGIAYDSLRGGMVEGAIIQLTTPGKPSREAFTKKDGRFRFDTVAPGSYALQMLHASLDTLGFLVKSTPFTVAPGDARRVDLAIPAARSLVPKLCTAAQRARGPSAIVGFVRDPDTNLPVDSAVVQLDASNKDVFGISRVPLIRTATTDSRGQFRICGLPEAVSGKLVATRKGIESGEVPVEIKDNLLVLRGVSFSLSNTAVTMVGDSGKTFKILRGTARLTGKVINERGEPLADAGVAVLNTLRSTKTNAAGLFTLDSLPAGSVTVQLRKIGYGLTDRSVDIASTNPPTSATLTMDKFVQILAAVHTTADRHQQGLDKVGFAARKKTSIGGVFKEGDQINHMASRITEMLRDIQGLHISRVDTGDSQDNQIRTTTAGLRGDCIDVFIDRAPFNDTAGELDKELQADVIEAIEFYDVASIPADYFGRAHSGCALLLLWTRQMVPPRGG